MAGLTQGQSSEVRIKTFNSADILYMVSSVKAGLHGLVCCTRSYTIFGTINLYFKSYICYNTKQFIVQYKIQGSRKRSTAKIFENTRIKKNR